MFSGIITDTTEVIKLEKVPDGLRLTFKCPDHWTDLVLGESIATNGVCLTIDEVFDDSYSATLIPKTLQMTTFGQTVPGRVNLERALKVGDRISGHFVQGHVDDVGTIAEIDQAEGYTIRISYPEDKRPLIVEKGSITVNGIALTVSDITSGKFSVSLVPHTLQQTTFGDLQTGDLVNLEYDVLGKYIINSIEAQR